MTTNRIDLLLLLPLLLSGCGTVPDQAPAVPQSAMPGQSQQPADASAVKAALYAQYDEWHGTPYRYGGLSKKGIDCSGFVYLTLQDRFGDTVPRTTTAQVKRGRPVAHGSRQPGDLVFFQTGYRKHHVGIYVEDGYFLHASASEGVTLSSLDEPYWSSRYWTTRRIRD